MTTLPLVLKKVKELPALPTAVVKLLDILRRHDTSAAQVTAILTEDSSLAANVLRVANSVVFRGYTPCGTVKDAVTRLGMRPMLDMVIGLSFQRTLPKRIPGYEVEATDFFQHGIAVATLSGKLVRALKCTEADITFTSGLLHDVGKLVVGVFLSEEVELWAHVDPATPFDEVEKKLLGIDHAEVGAEAAKLWHLPESICNVIKWHHDPLKVEDPLIRKMASIVHVADAMATMFGYGADASGLQWVANSEVIDFLQLSRESLELIASEAVESIAQTVDAYQGQTAA